MRCDSGEGRKKKRVGVRSPHLVISYHMMQQLVVCPAGPFFCRGNMRAGLPSIPHRAWPVPLLRGLWKGRTHTGSEFVFFFPTPQRVIRKVPHAVFGGSHEVLQNIRWGFRYCCCTSVLLHLVLKGIAGRGIDCREVCMMCMTCTQALLHFVSDDTTAWIDRSTVDSTILSLFHRRCLCYTKYVLAGGIGRPILALQARRLVAVFYGRTRTHFFLLIYSVYHMNPRCLAS